MTSDALAAPDPDDVIVVASVTSPGIAEISDSAGRVFKWDKKEAKGSSGATLTYQGEDLATFDVTFSFWDWATQKDDWEAFRKVLEASADAKRPTGIDIYHSELDAIGIRSVVVTKLGKVKRRSDGLRTVVVSFSQYRAPSKAGGTPNGSKANAAAGKKAEPVDPVDAEIDNLMKQAAAA